MTLFGVKGRLKLLERLELGENTDSRKDRGKYEERLCGDKLVRRGGCWHSDRNRCDH